MDKNNWEELLVNLSSEKNNDGEYRIYYESELKESGSDEEIINTKADLSYNEKATSDNPETDYYKNIQSELFTTLENNNASLNDIKDNLSKIWPAIIWNDSMAKLIADFWYYYKKSENDFIVEKEDGTIDSYFTNGTIAAAGAEASFRKRDIRDADAGYFFGREDSTYEECYYLGSRDGSTCTLILTSSYENNKGEKSIGTRTYTISDIIFRSSQTDKIEKLLNKDFSMINGNWLTSLFDSSNKWCGTSSIKNTGTFRPGYIDSATFSIEPEIVKVTLNPWVLPWYNFDADTYSKVRGTDKHYSTLANKDYLQMTREQELKDERGTIGKKDNRKITIKNEKGEDETIDMNTNTSNSSYEWLRLLMPQYKRRVEVEDINRNFWVIGQVVGAISAYLFDDESPISKLIQGILNEILQLWENVLLLWAAIGTQKTRNYKKTHCEVVYLTNNDFQPYLKYDGFDTIEEVIQTAKKENKDVLTELHSYITKVLDYLKYQYSDYNLAILPSIRINNYEHNYYSQIWYPGVWILNRNKTIKENTEWEIYSFKNSYENSVDNIFINNGITDNEIGLVINLKDYASNIYGIHENEETYSYILPLSYAEKYRENSEVRYYGLAREEIEFQCDVIKGKLSLTLDYYDIGRELILSDNEKKYIYQIKKIEDVFLNQLSSQSMDNQATLFEYSDESPAEKQIIKGYYQGELLSAHSDTKKRVFNIVVFPDIYLEPSFQTYNDLITTYKNGTNSLIKQDEVVLRDFLSKVFELNSVGEEEFWKTYVSSDIYNNWSNYWGQINSTKTALEGLKTINTIPFSPNDAMHDTGKKAYEDESSWKKAMTEKLTKTKEGTIDSDSIIFIKGSRDYSYEGTWDNTLGSYSRHECYLYHPYRSDGKYSGFASPIMCLERGRSTVTTGAALAFTLPNGNLSYGYYPSHVNASSEVEDGDTGESATWLSFKGVFHPFLREESITEEDSNGKMVSYPALELYEEGRTSGTTQLEKISEVISNNRDIKRIYPHDGGGISGPSQYLVMRKKEDKEFNESNWLVVQVVEDAVAPAAAQQYDNKWYRTYCEDYYYNCQDLTDEVYEGLIRKKAQDLYNSGTHGIKALGEKLEAFFCGDNAEIKTGRSYEEGSAKAKAFDAFLTYCNKHKNNTFLNSPTLTYFKYQAALAGRYSPRYKQACIVYSKSELNSDNYNEHLQKIYKDFYPTKDAPLFYDFGLGTPVEGLSLEGYCFLQGDVSHNLSIYAFGPTDVSNNYARQRITRGLKISGNNAKPCYKDKINEAGDIDNLRSTYKVVAATNTTINLEKYKTLHRGSQYEQRSYYNNTVGQFPDDKFGNNGYTVEWDEDLINYE